MENTREELKAKTITELNKVIAIAAAITAATGEDVMDEQAMMKLEASKLFAEMLFGEEIVLDDKRGFMFKSDASAVPEGIC